MDEDNIFDNIKNDTEEIEPRYDPTSICYKCEANMCGYDLCMEDQYFYLLNLNEKADS